MYIQAHRGVCSTNKINLTDNNGEYNLNNKAAAHFVPRCKHRMYTHTHEYSGILKTDECVVHLYAFLHTYICTYNHVNAKNNAVA